MNRFVRICLVATIGLAVMMGLRLLFPVLSEWPNSAIPLGVSITVSILVGDTIREKWPSKNQGIDAGVPETGD